MHEPPHLHGAAALLRTGSANGQHGLRSDALLATVDHALFAGPVQAAAVLVGHDIDGRAVWCSEDGRSWNRSRTAKRVLPELLRNAARSAG